VRVVVPPARPVTSPVAATTVPTALVLLTHVPPVVPILESVVLVNWHIVVVPVIGVGSGITVTIAVLITVDDT
jgi:hypothetical protein